MSSRQKQRRLSPGTNRGGFILFESMLAVTIFVMAVLVLGRCVESCMQAERLKEEDSRAMLFLQNRMAEVEAGAVPIEKEMTVEGKGMFAGMSLRQSSKPLKRKNEKNQEILGLRAVSLELSWMSRQEKQSRSLLFYVYPRQT